MRKKMTVLILPVGLDCNMACLYCYHDCALRRRSIPERMSDDVLQRTIRGSANLAEDIDFLWHGGEPLLAGVQHFKSALTFEQETKFVGQVRNMVQTNATLLTDNPCQFFVENHFFLSTSLDGPVELNDAYRVSVGGRGTYRFVVEAIKRWRKTGGSIGAVSLITKANVKYPEMVYCGLKQAGLKSCAFHFCAEDGFGKRNATPPNEEAAVFLKAVFDLWLKEDNPDFLIRNFRNVIRVLYGGTTIDCASRPDGCLGFIAVTANGDVFPCHRFVAKTEFRLGSVLEENLADIYHRSLGVYRSMSQIVQECEGCKWLPMCGGGCAFERFNSNGSFATVHPACSAKQQLFAHVNERTKPFMVEKKGSHRPR